MWEEGRMKSVGEIPPSLLERDGETGLPPGGGLALVIAGSILFWGALIWVVL